ncbi:hypothetical protein CEP53_014130 [Fusarium sp. AF-6]|nr:hypothetical protein CEP53_014130 [Fusarium sp. AF-6]
MVIIASGVQTFSIDIKKPCCQLRPNFKVYSCLDNPIQATIAQRQQHLTITAPRQRPKGSTYRAEAANLMTQLHLPPKHPSSLIQPDI